VRPAYGLPNPRSFLQEKAPNTQFVPTGFAVLHASKVTNIYDVTSPSRSGRVVRS
jgi:hypothetical protein